jgi:hypothetical protein
MGKTHPSGQRRSELVESHIIIGYYLTRPTARRDFRPNKWQGRFKLNSPKQPWVVREPRPTIRAAASLCYLLFVIAA